MICPIRLIGWHGIDSFGVASCRRMVMLTPKGFVPLIPFAFFHANQERAFLETAFQLVDQRTYLIELFVCNQPPFEFPPKNPNS